MTSHVIAPHNTAHLRTDAHAVLNNDRPSDGITRLCTNVKHLNASSFVCQKTARRFVRLGTSRACARKRLASRAA